MKNDSRETLKMFAQESADRLARINSELRRLTQNKQVEMETVHTIFRDTHSLKSAANLLGMKPVEQLAHKLEDILELIRSGAETPDAQLVALLKGGYVRIGQLLKNPHILQVIDISQEIAIIDKFLTRRSPKNS